MCRFGSTAVAEAQKSARALEAKVFSYQRTRRAWMKRIGVPELGPFVGVQLR
jgi:hypothetical protein